MLASIEYRSKNYKIDFEKPLDISIPIRSSNENINAWYIGDPIIEPVVMDKWIGNVKSGGSVNFNNIQFNPHAHATHTECVGHITETIYSVNEHLKTYFFLSQLISITPKRSGDDFIIGKDDILKSNIDPIVEALVIRTMPNTDDKLSKHYSHTNPPYLSEEAAQVLVNLGIKHLLVDLPSVDKEKDNGQLLAHKAFWQTSNKIRLDATITEFIYVSNDIKDGLYFLNLQIASFENDATPSKPVLYKIID